MSPTNPSIPPANGSCPLLDLPGELLNQIYSHVLTEPHGLSHHNSFQHSHLNSRSPSPPQPTHLPIESNQLKYVSRRLYSETRGLGIRYNDIYFVSFAAANTFLRTVADGECKFLKTMVIASSMDLADGQAGEAGLLGVLRFARCYPAVMFRVHFTHWTAYNVKSFFVHFFGLAIVFKKESRFHADVVAEEAAVKAIVGPGIMARKKGDGVLPAPPNFMCFPVQEEFVEREWKKNLVRTLSGLPIASTVGRSRIMLQGGFVGLRDLMRGVVEDGI